MNKIFVEHRFQTALLQKIAAGSLSKIGERDGGRSAIAAATTPGVQNWSQRKIADLQYSEIFDNGNTANFDGLMTFTTQKSFSLTETDIQITVNSVAVPFTKINNTTFTLLFPVTKNDTVKVLFPTLDSQSYDMTGGGVSAANINLLSGYSALAVAIKKSSAVNDFLDISVLELNKENSGYKKYTFVRAAGTTIINGLDDGVPTRSTLHFSETDVVSVVLDGVECNSDLYDRTANNIIRFKNPLKNEKNYIEIIVSQNVSLNSIKLRFNKSHADLDSSWGNVNEILIGNDIYSIYICNDITPIITNTQYRFSIYSLKAYLLLGHRPYTAYDRLHNVMYDLQLGTDNKDSFIAVKNSKNEFDIVVTTSKSLVDLQLPLKIASRSLEDISPEEASASDVESVMHYSNIIGPAI